MFIKIIIYSDNDSVCFNDLVESKREAVIININEISSISSKQLFPISTIKYRRKYPYRVISMNNGNKFWGVQENIDRLESMLINLHKLIV